jgi:class II aldolase/adducin N-terminal domain-containing protein
MTKKARGQELELRAGIVVACRHMNVIGLNQGTSGNISARLGDRMLITPSGVPYHEMAGEDLAVMRIDGDLAHGRGRWRPRPNGASISTSGAHDPRSAPSCIRTVPSPLRWRLRAGICPPVKSYGPRAKDEAAADAAGRRAEAAVEGFGVRGRGAIA